MHQRRHEQGEGPKRRPRGLCCCGRSAAPPALCPPSITMPFLVSRSTASSTASRNSCASSCRVLLSVCARMYTRAHTGRFKQTAHLTTKQESTHPKKHACRQAHAHTHLRALSRSHTLTHRGVLGIRPAPGAQRTMRYHCPWTSMFCRRAARQEAQRVPQGTRTP